LTGYTGMLLVRGELRHSHGDIQQQCFQQDDNQRLQLRQGFALDKANQHGNPEVGH